MTDADFTVFIVDDDPGVLRALARLVRGSGYEVQTFASPQEFLAQHDATKLGCAILDVAMPGLDGLQLQQAIAASGIDRPVVFLTGQGDIPTSVRAMKAGAIDFLTKPVSEEVLLAAIARIREQEQKNLQFRRELLAVRARFATLTAREREVLSYVVAGRLNKQIAGDLGTV
jgi:FixJ family two-component response regulator